ncbi:MAG: hypothetical protein R3B90_11000 [Planctomycetaceae bacterium]
MFLAAGVFLVALLGWFAISDRRFRGSRLHEIAESRLDADPSDITALADIDGGDPHQIRITEDDEAR